MWNIIVCSVGDFAGGETVYGPYVHGKYLVVKAWLIVDAATGDASNYIPLSVKADTTTLYSVNSGDLSAGKNDMSLDDTILEDTQITVEAGSAVGTGGTVSGAKLELILKPIL